MGSVVLVPLQQELTRWQLFKWKLQKPGAMANDAQQSLKCGASVYLLIFARGMMGVVCSCLTQLETTFQLFFTAVIPCPGVCESWI